MGSGATGAKADACGASPFSSPAGARPLGEGTGPGNPGPAGGERRMRPEGASASVAADACRARPFSPPAEVDLGNGGWGTAGQGTAQGGGASGEERGPDPAGPSSPPGVGREATAVVAVTGKGVSVGLAISRWLGEADLFVPEHLSSRLEGRHLTYRFPLSGFLAKVYPRYRRLVLVLALGAAVRLLAPLLEDKRSDPGVVVVDERGWNVISLLSGHLGGANALARELAAFLGARAVITTATDLSGLPALDLLVEEKGWRCEDHVKFPALLSAMLEGEEILVYQEGGGGLVEELAACGVNVSPSAPGDPAWDGGRKWRIAVTDRDLPSPSRAPEGRLVIIRPRRLVLGLGCRRGTPGEEIEAAVLATLRRHGLSPAGVSLLATVADKREEPGIALFAARWELPLRFLSREELGAAPAFSPPSGAALRALGIPGVCEQAALVAGGGGELLVPKETYRGVTVAVASARDEEKIRRRGELKVVGLGPGDVDLMSPRALRALLSADTVVGYEAYVRQVEHIPVPGRTVAFRMGEEVERVRAAVREAMEGKVVCLVSGGDPGIYGMAGALGDLLLRGEGIPGDLEVEMIPGIPALCAAAALLGSPLAGDFAVISLSDYLVEWEEIERRIRSSAAADMVLVLYNPASSRRREALARAAEIVMEYRSGRTPAGVVRNAFRPGQEVCTVLLEDLRGMELGMDSLVLVGNSSTRVFRGLMITPRGHRLEGSGGGVKTAPPRTREGG